MEPALVIAETELVLQQIQQARLAAASRNKDATIARTIEDLSNSEFLAE
jgi:hypothetical protein